MEVLPDSCFDRPLPTGSMKIASSRNHPVKIRRGVNCFLPRTRSMYLVLVFGAALLLMLQQPISALEAKWTPNEEDSGGPLPLSSQQRQHLLQLEDTIRNSPNPDNTLQQVAEANQMPPEELLGLLERNRRDMQAARGAGVASPRGKSTIVKLITSLGLLVTRTASQNPKAFVLTVTTLVLLILVATSAPRTGLVVSTQRRAFLSGGPTTIWSPPTRFVQRKFLDSSGSLSVTTDAAHDFVRQVRSLLSDDEESTTAWHKIPRKHPSNLQYVASAQTSLNASEFLPSTEHEEEEEEGEDSDKDEATNQILNMLLEHASNLLASRDLTGFDNSMRLVTTTDDDSSSRKRKRHVVLVVAGMGDWNRFGIQPLRVTHESDSEDQTSLTLSTLTGGHFDGHLLVTIEKKKQSDKEDTTTQPAVIIRIALLFPKNGRKNLKKAVAMRIVQSLNQSIETSLRTRTRQSLTRRSQSTRFKGRASTAAKKRRHTRFTKEMALEEMAAERRRRWQRQNPNAGSYRPSGDRMKSPNNAVY